MLSAARLPQVLFALLVAAAPARADTLEGRVVGVASGDTLTVLDASHKQQRIRLAGVVAPQLAHPFSDRARTSLSMLAFNKEARVQWNRREPDGRIVGKVLVPTADCPNCPPSLDLGLAQISSGMAWWRHEQPRDLTQEDGRTYGQAEFNAKIRRLGLWSGRATTPPGEAR